MKCVVNRRQRYLNRAFMMRLIKFALGIVMSMAGTAYAGTDSGCLKHLGGAFGDVECFNGLSNEIKKENSKLAESIALTIPNGNRNKTRLKAYLEIQAKLRNLCELGRQSMTNWVQEAATVNPRYHDYDVAYYECVYTALSQENKFLKGLLKNANQQ